MRTGASNRAGAHATRAATIDARCILAKQRRVLSKDASTRQWREIKNSGGQAIARRTSTSALFAPFFAPPPILTLDRDIIMKKNILMIFFFFKVEVFFKLCFRFSREAVHRRHRLEHLSMI